MEGIKMDEAYVGSEALPSVTATLTEKGIEVEMVQWEKLNARAVDRIVRAITKERNRLRKLVLRDSRREEMENA